jgi:hypothetical protein
MYSKNEVLALKTKPCIEITSFVEDILPYYHGADRFFAPFSLALGAANKALRLKE